MPYASSEYDYYDIWSTDSEGRSILRRIRKGAPYGQASRTEEERDNATRRGGPRSNLSFTTRTWINNPGDFQRLYTQPAWSQRPRSGPIEIGAPDDPYETRTRSGRSERHSRRGPSSSNVQSATDALTTRFNDSMKVGERDVSPERDIGFELDRRSAVAASNQSSNLEPFKNFQNSVKTSLETLERSLIVLVKHLVFDEKSYRNRNSNEREDLVVLDFGNAHWAMDRGENDQVFIRFPGPAIKYNIPTRYQHLFKMANAIVSELVGLLMCMIELKNRPTLPNMDEAHGKLAAYGRKERPYLSPSFRNCFDIELLAIENDHGRYDADIRKAAQRIGVHSPRQRSPLVGEEEMLYLLSCRLRGSHANAGSVR